MRLRAGRLPPCPPAHHSMGASSALRSRIPAGCSMKHQPARRAAHAQSEGRLNLSRPQGEPPPGATAAHVLAFRPAGGPARPGPAGSTRTCALQPRRVRWSLHRRAPAKRRWPLPDRVGVPCTHARGAAAKPRAWAKRPEAATVNVRLAVCLYHKEAVGEAARSRDC